MKAPNQAVGAGGVRPTRPGTIKPRIGRRYEPYVVGGVSLLGIMVLLSWRLVFVLIPPGHVGALFSLFSGGTVLNEVLPEGVAFKWPWNRIYIFETRLQAMPVHIDTLSLEGMSIGVDATVMFHINPTSADFLLKQVGQDYIERLVYPQTIHAIRKEIATRYSHRVYTLDTATLTADILSFLRAEPKSSLIQYDEIAIRQITLPPNMSKAIEDKLTQEQRAASYEFIIAGTRSEADRRRIEAIGLENYYSIIARSLSKDVLTWSGIQATLALAKSNNSKVVVVGGGQNQMPLILGSDIAGASPTAAAPGNIPLNADKLSFPPLESTVEDPIMPSQGLNIPGHARASPIESDLPRLTPTTGVPADPSKPK